MALGAAAIAAGSQLASGVINYFGAKRRQKSEFKHNRQMAQLAYERDLEQWNRQNEHNLKLWHLQNEYNLPANQMSRLREAGLNPNLIAGQGAAGGQATAIQKAESPKYQAPRARFNYTPLRTPDILSLYQNFQVRNAQIDNLRAQEDLTREKALTEASLRVHRRDDVFARATKNYVTAKYSEHMSELELRQRQENLEKAKLDRGLKSYELKWMKDFGMRPGDPLHYRWLMRLLDQFGPNFIK